MRTTAKTGQLLGIVRDLRANGRDKFTEESFDFIPWGHDPIPRNFHHSESDVHATFPAGGVWASGWTENLDKLTTLSQSLE
jgi:hypothetical protein